MKVELPEQKQVDSDRATPESTQPNHPASYTNTILKHNHLSHHQKLSEPSITRYSTGTHETKQPDYIARYNSASHDSKSNEPYITSYANKPSNEANQPDYLAGHTSVSHGSKSNEPYITSYANKPSNKEESIPAQDSTTPYVTQYGSPEDETEGYVGYPAAYKKKQENGSAAKHSVLNSKSGQELDGKKAAPEANLYHIASATSGTHDSEESIPAEDSTTPYVTQYGSPEDETEGYVGYPAAYKKKQENGSATKHSVLNSKSGQELDGKKAAPEANLHHIASATSGTHDSKESIPAQDSTTPYVTQYGSPEDETEGYVGYPAAYKKKPENGNAAKHSVLNRKSGQELEAWEGVQSSKVDHTEAFKTGFFAVGDLFVGNMMTLKFPVPEISPFLPRKEAKSIPLSMSQLPSVFELFSISQGSTQAKSMRGTLDQCEGEPITGETKICATSLESMLEFVDTIIGSATKRNILTTSHPSASGIPMQKYTILEVQDINAPKWVACHPLPYPYAIYYCHFIATGSKVFKVSLGGENGAKIEALGICHLDTSDWYPGHIIFKLLGFMPGKNAPVCHFFPVKHLMWVPHSSKATV
ncbi:unnamed protein product [Lupinus luteus]|uniref:BURP domain-containing protein n=1 Tax=Lupinus luteus TaxID=3873 RepID=A0AAV1XCP0_LUPLU